MNWFSRLSGKQKQSDLQGKELEPETKDAKFLALGFWCGCIDKTVKSDAIRFVGEGVVVSAGRQVLRLMKDLELACPFEKGIGLIALEIVITQSIRSKEVFDLGRMIAGSVHRLVISPTQQEQASLLDRIQALRQKAESLRILDTDAILRPLQDLMNKSPLDTKEVSRAGYQVFQSIMKVLNGCPTPEEGEQQRLSKALLIEAVLEASLTSTPKTAPTLPLSEKVAGNCLFMGLWTGTLFRMSGVISAGDPATIANLFMTPAQQAGPFIRKLNCSINTIAHGYGAVVSDIEQRFSSREASAYRIGYLLEGAASPNQRFRSSEDLTALQGEMTKIGLSETMLKPLKDSIARGDNSEIAQSGMMVLGLLESAL